MSGRLHAFIELGKLRLSALAIVAVLAGLWLGASEPMSTGTPSTRTIVLTAHA